MIRRLPFDIPGGGKIVHLRRPESWDEYSLPSFGDEIGLSVGPNAPISRAYVEVLRQQGFEGTEDIPEEFIVDP